MPVALLAGSFGRVAHIFEHRTLRRVPVRDSRPDVDGRPPDAGSLFARRRVRDRGRQHRGETDAHEDADLHRRLQRRGDEQRVQRYVNRNH